MAVFGEYDQEALDRQFDISRAVADFARTIAWWPQASAEARDRLGGERGVAYGPSPAETVDVFAPPGAAAAPVQVFFHGGYWRRFSKDDFSLVAPAFVAAGAVVVVVDYALMPGVRMAELLRQCRQALAWVQGNIARFGGDPARVFISGNSAGGHIVAMMLATDWRAFGLDRAPVRGGVAISGLYDLAPIRLSYLNQVLALTEEEAAANAPLNNPAQPGLAMAVVHGDRETDEFARQARDYGALMRRLGRPVTLKPIAGHDHMSITRSLAEPDGEVCRLIKVQMGLP